jgi:biofilm PGA synthesis N-glycosyltransferase PgaC
MTFMLTFFVLYYTIFIGLAVIGWFRLPKLEIPSDHKPQTFLSVLIPIRNEAGSIIQLLKDLEKQSYPKELFEVLVIDDHSDDGSVSLVNNFRTDSDLNIKLLELKNGIGNGKKSALAIGIVQSKGKLIVQTDGDCRVQEDWLKLLEYVYAVENKKFISGPVCLEAGKSWFEKMQVVEFAALIGAGAAAIGLGKPNMCNGANLAYEKAAFFAVNGYSGNEQIASGDDEFLMHKIGTLFPGQISFLKVSSAVVYTSAKENIRDFIAQRVRWASKWRFYQNKSAQVLALLVFGTNFLLLLGFVGWLIGFLSLGNFIIPYLIKTCADLVFLTIILRFLRREKYLFFTLPLQLFYAPYVIYCALAGLNGQYDWKGRTFKNRD